MNQVESAIHPINNCKVNIYKFFVVDSWIEKFWGIYENILKSMVMWMTAGTFIVNIHTHLMNLIVLIMQVG